MHRLHMDYMGPFFRNFSMTMGEKYRKIGTYRNIVGNTWKDDYKSQGISRIFFCAWRAYLVNDQFCGLPPRLGMSAAVTRTRWLSESTWEPR